MLTFFLWGQTQDEDYDEAQSIEKGKEHKTEVVCCFRWIWRVIAGNCESLKTQSTGLERQRSKSNRDT